MARGVPRVAEHHAPGQVGDPAPQLAVDEVAQAPGGKPEWRERRDEIHEAQVIDVVAPRGERHGEHHAEQSAVKRHAALPDGEDLQRMRGVVTRLVKEHVAQTPAQYHAEYREEQQIVELRAVDGRPAPVDPAHAQSPAGGEAREVHEPVPAHGKRADGEGDRIDVGMNQHLRGAIVPSRCGKMARSRRNAWRRTTAVQS